MNANEILDELKYVTKVLNMNTDVDTKPLVEAATMLRQQQAEIEALKLQLHTTLTNRDLRTYDGKTEMNNEPVAWMSVELNGRTVLATYEFETAIPLYTHPVEHDLGIAEAIGFEKGYQAGLRKAQEWTQMN